MTGAKERREADRSSVAATRAAAEARHDAAASVIFKALDDLERESSPGKLSPASEFMRTGVSEIRVQAAHLPKEWRGLIEPLASIIERAQRLDEGGFHYDSALAIVRTCCAFGRDVCASLLSRRALPQEPTRIREYRVAFSDYTAEEADAYIDYIEEFEQERTAWLKSHPDFRE